MTLSAVILEDNPLHLKGAEKIISESNLFKLEASFEKFDEFYSYLLENDFDIAFIDIEIGKESILPQLKKTGKSFNIVFLTSYPQFALESYDLNPIHFLLKPLKKSDLIEVHSRLMQRKRHSFQKDHIFIKIGFNLTKKIEIKDIYFVQAFDDYIKINTKNEVFITYLTLKDFIEKVDSPELMQVHRSYVVNTANLGTIEGDQILFGNSVIPIGNSYKASLNEFISQNLISRK